MRRRNYQNRTLHNSKGFSIVELVVVIAIMAVLVGVVAPNFFKYINSNRQKACETDRERLLSVYKRLVYDGSMEIDISNVNALLNKTYTDNTILNEIKDCKCQKNGHYSARIVDDNKVYIKCDECGDEVMADFMDWKGTELAETDDDPFPTPTPTPTPTDTPTPTPTDTPTPTPTKRVDAIWPYPDATDEAGNPIWGVNPVPGQKLTITVPTILFTARDGNEYVVINRNRTNNKLDITYEKSKDPAAFNKTDEEDAILYSGVTITEPKLVNGGKQITNVNFGDIVVCNGRRYIYASHSVSLDNWPLKKDNKSGNFYLVGEE